MVRFFKILLAIIASFVAITAAAGGTYYAVVTRDAEFDAALLPDSSAKTVFFDANGSLIENSENRQISCENIPENVVRAFVASEDKRFFRHKGIDYIRIFGALKNNIARKKLSEGGSTITQQLVKNTHLTHEKTINRKLKEIKIAKQLEKEFSKSEILAMYLNVIYFGNGLYGIGDAARAIFDKSPDELNAAECATLAAILKNPKKYSPLNSYDNALARRNLVLKLMFEQGYLSENEFEKSVDSVIDVKRNAQTDLSQSYFISAAAEAADILNLSPKTLLSKNYKIYTYYDEAAQRAAECAIDDENLYVKNSQNAAPDRVAIIVGNNVRGVCALASTSQKQIFEFKRNIGSTAKPIFVYAPAFERKLITPATPVLDEKTSFGAYSPSNYGDKYSGWIDIKTAVKTSSNVAAVKVYNALDPDYFRQFAEKLGIVLHKNDNNSTVALGNFGNGADFITLLGGYAMLANGGEYAKPTFVRKIVAANGRTVYSDTQYKERIIGKDSAYLLSDILNETAQSGTAKALRGLNFEVCSKTGTVGDSYGNTDAYNVSYTSEHTALLWHGNNGASDEYSLDAKETGGAYATLAMRKLLTALYKKYPPSDIEIPDGIVGLQIDAYAQLNKQEVLLASENTPLRYVKDYRFSKSCAPDKISGYFVDFTVDDVNVELTDAAAVISFNAAEYLNCDIIKVTADGEETLCSLNCGKSDGEIKYTDAELQSNTYAEYYILPYFYNQFNQKIYGKTQKTDKIYLFSEKE